ncbi:hypothetical protein L6164_024811 [Bauhinia variegata]|uniref:Uncharacterized protein n=1 Tax=Bauhinia variegata TaxID=167791 RepID=A0ACB9LYE0_BAUVA|nr:hypothetical protein L6164_024811 [Bauhinia variegata]
MCSNFCPCTDHPMDHGLNSHCLKGLCPLDRRPPTSTFSLLKTHTLGLLFFSQVKKEKYIYHALNMLSIDVTKKCLVNEGWCPVIATNQIQLALQRATVDSNSQVGAIFQILQTKESPPTYFRTNKFTSSFQEIVDAYGVAKYREANPGVYTIITFPFLFAVMFGDWGHGICLLLATLYFIIREKKFSTQKLGDIVEMTFGGRYVI